MSKALQVTHPHALRFLHQFREPVGTKCGTDIANVKSPSSCAHLIVRNYLFRKVGVFTRVELVLYCRQGKHNNGSSAEMAS